MTKLRIGVCTVRNEEQYIEDWANMVRYFCERVVAIVDPDTTDKTVEILEQKCPWVEIYWQDRGLGDSDDTIQGPEQNLIMHANKTKWVQENVYDGEWFMEIAVDERFAHRDWDQLLKEIEFAQENGFDAIVHRGLFEPVLVDEGQLERENGKWYYNPKREPNGNILNQFLLLWNDYYALEHSRIHMKYAGFVHNNKPHSGFKEKAKNHIVSSVPIWHYHRLKYNTILSSNWRDAKGGINRVLDVGKGRVPLVAMLGEHNFAEKYNSFIDLTKFEIPPQKTFVVPQLIQSFKPRLFEIDVGKRKPKMLLIGKNQPRFTGYAPEFYSALSDSYDITWMGEQAYDISLNSYKKDMVEYNSVLGPYRVTKRDVSLTTILAAHNLKIFDFDIILHIQDQTFFIDDFVSPVPYLYIMNWSFYPRIMKLPSMILASTHVGMDFVNKESQIPSGYLPHCLTDKYIGIKIDEFNREHLISFAGETNNMAPLYYDRRVVLTYLKEMLGDAFVWPSTDDHLLSEFEYMMMLRKSKYGINIPTKLGFSFRDLEIPACGAILITRYNRDLQKLGFKHGINCYFFNDMKEIPDLIKDYNPTIAKKGWQLVQNMTLSRNINEVDHILQMLLK